MSSLPFDTSVSASGTSIECTDRTSDRYLRSFPLHARPLTRRGGFTLPFSPASILPSLAPRDFPSLTAPRRFLSHTRRILDAWRAMAGHARHCPRHLDTPHTPAQACHAGNTCPRLVALRMSSQYGVNLLNSWRFRNLCLPMAYIGLYRISKVHCGAMRGDTRLVPRRNALAHDVPEMTAGAYPGESGHPRPVWLPVS